MKSERERERTREYLINIRLKWRGEERSGHGGNAEKKLPESTEEIQNQIENRYSNFGELTSVHLLITDRSDQRTRQLKTMRRCWITEVALSGVGSFALDVESSSGISVKMVDRKTHCPSSSVRTLTWRVFISWSLQSRRVKITIFRYLLYLFAFVSLLFFLSHLSLDLQMRMPEKWWNQKFLSVIPITTRILYSFYLHKQIRL